ncbi:MULTISPECIES: hypothetical protein [unclassified Nonomuraea]|uniref:hypothetical protein n=1 Tax=unclassified Nonomuraea TaxID=2593643 RepID=UPI0033F97323
MTVLMHDLDGLITTRHHSVTVIDSVPAAARGMASLLRAQGYEVHEYSTIPQSAGDDAAPLLLALRDSADWDFLLHCARTAKNRCIVAVLVDPDPATYSRALRCGARSAVDHRAPVEEIARVLEAALNDYTLFPAPIASELAENRRCGPPPGIELSSMELQWIAALAGGSTIAELAVRACYSQREMYRSLRELYDRIGARNRTEAVVMAARWGLFEFTPRGVARKRAS